MAGFLWADDGGVVWNVLAVLISAIMLVSAAYWAKPRRLLKHRLAGMWASCVRR